MQCWLTVSANNTLECGIFKCHPLLCSATISVFFRKSKVFIKPLLYLKGQQLPNADVKMRQWLRSFDSPLLITPCVVLYCAVVYCENLSRLNREKSCVCNVGLARLSVILADGRCWQPIANRGFSEVMCWFWRALGDTFLHVPLIRCHCKHHYPATTMTSNPDELHIVIVT